MASPNRPAPVDKVLGSFNSFFKYEAAGGLALMAFTMAAMIWANSPWSQSYYDFFQTKFTIGFGTLVLSKPILLWINDGLMAIFFFVIGLEIKREMMVGGLSSPKKTIMPIAAAIGGMAVPALIFVAFNGGLPSISGWGVPMATDIAFALGIMSLLGKRVPISLKVFLTAVAIVDDIGAILVIALFYTSSLNVMALLIGLAVFGFMLIMNLRWDIRPSIPYLVCGIILWFAFLLSGIHATIAGVLAALAIPASTRMKCEDFLEEMRGAANLFEKGNKQTSCVLTGEDQQHALHNMEHAYYEMTPPLQKIEHALHPWVAFAIMPIFALANAGVALEPDIIAELMAPVSLGIFFGLVVGKQIGVTGACWLVRKLKLANVPDGTDMLQLHGAACLAGVGFTMSIFIANLAYPAGSQLVELSKIAVLFASLTAGILGYFTLKIATRNTPGAKEEAKA